jgi:fructan beta-fructosidase
MRFCYILLSVLALATQTGFAQLDYRPEYHFTPPKNWINDPNGLVFHNGEYHLFYQHNPFANQWGHMSWGHAVSRDLLHWEHLPLAIPEFTHPDEKTKTAIFSGSSVIDKGNQEGICPPGTKDCMVAIYTGNVTEGDRQTHQYQNLAFSADNGRTWTQYAKNPILDIGSKEFRDPNVFFHGPTQKWVMAVVKATEHQVAFYESNNLKDWQLMSHFGPTGDTTKVWECPALMQVPVMEANGRTDSKQTRWVLFVSAGHPQKDYVGMQYFVGNFDGKKFTLDPENPKPIAPAIGNQTAGSVVDWGKDYYAAIQYNGLISSQPIMIGWLNNWAYAGDIPTTPFKGAMSLPRQISLKRTSEGLELVQWPINGVFNLRDKAINYPSIQLDNKAQVLEKTTNNTYELELSIRLGTAKTVGVRLAKGTNEETVLQYANGKLQLDRRRSGNVAFNKRFPSVEEAPLQPQGGTITLRIFVDKSIVEVFANDGERVITDQIFPTETTGGIEIFVEGGTATFGNVIRWPMKSSKL